MMTKYVLDASLEPLEGMFTFCPIEGDIHGSFKVITGLGYISNLPPPDGKLVGIWHPDGQAEVDAFCQTYSDELQEMAVRIQRAAE